jgi:hypothetical protein
MSEDLDDLVIGKLSDDEAELLLSTTSFGRSEKRWTKEEVENRLVEAARGHEAVIGRAAPSRKLTHWIDWRLFRNLSTFDANCQRQGLYLKTRIPDRSRGSASAQEITRILEAIEWPITYLTKHDAERVVLSIWFWCEVEDEPFSRWHKAACAHRSTAYRRLDRAFLIIMDGLLRDGVSP